MIIKIIKSRSMRLAVNVESMGKLGIAYKTLIGKSEGKRPFGRRRSFVVG
jgi:hypothetical protein